MIQKLSLFLVPALLFTLSAPYAHALTLPSYPSCTQPQGTVSAQYASGTHGIVGSTQTYTGSDTVYTLSDSSLLQCFCPEDSSMSGIQTDWFQITDPNDPQIQVLKNDGWMYVANGANWGLNDAAYLAKNVDYSCHGSVNGTSSSQGSTNNSTNTSSAPVQGVLGATTQALAFTGGVALPYLYLVGAIISFLTGIYVLRAKN